ncbi:phosphoribosylformylglycinamidine synthase [Patescibacteria group bacterium]|nr:phosphoribosylformylglycinamidine synthase [Patescibacteria group bacterium]MBU1016252.1 phosphoribosylformylglycinamidine synthase [Patescibacteria group bacterium]MBU1685484.1 phosphoribosylformylglycinamidine synthase [Patescibacteria group bacterium]MBU1939110.1 phosphoribosylformylglycinamidine synthase [Patescibacteria group bacterium]
MSAFRLEVRNTIKDSRAATRLSRLKADGYKVKAVVTADIYTVNKAFKAEEKERIGKMLTNPIFESYAVDKLTPPKDFDYAIETGYLPGVTDNVGHTARESIEDLLDVEFKVPEENVHSSHITYLKGDLSREQVYRIAESFVNPLIQRINIKSKEEFEKDGGMDLVIPKVTIKEKPQADEVNLEISDGELEKLGKLGILDKDGSRRGPLALRLSYLHVIRDYFRREGRKPKDVEIESIAQTWSEHCKHTIFRDPIDEIEDGIYKHYIKAATNKIRKDKGDKDFCVSVFTDNSGGIEFDKDFIITDKAETHNSPSALDPFGGAITGIVGVNRDTLGFGIGAKPIINRYGYCFGNPQDETPLYRQKGMKNPTLLPRQIMDGVVAGVNAGGNQSGIPAPQGWAYFEDRYRGKPLVFVGTIGLLPKEINGKPSWKKAARAGDKIVNIGGYVGLDGVHGATFSSEALNTGSPVTAVQIGDPITQKKLSDAIVKEARDLGLYNSITDNGAGGISCSVAEMARECGGCEVELEKVKTKYANLSPWEIWISESQERMTLSVPESKLDQFMDLMERRGVEAYVIGTFTDSGRCKVTYHGEMVMDLEMNFLHEGLPTEQQRSTYTKPKNEEPHFACPENLNDVMQKMLARNNLCSYEYISIQYDHEVQAGSCIKPLHGKGRVNGPATVTAPLLGQRRGIVASQGINPRYSDIDTYHMAACAIDTAIRNAVSVGGNVDHMAMMDNFCWCSSNEAERLGQLKEAARACYEVTIAMGTPFISGKDSMFNDFSGFDEKGDPIKISVPPTLLVSSISVVPDVNHCQTMDLKVHGDLIYVIGETKDELGGSEYFYMHEAIGNSVPTVDTVMALDRYRRFYQAAQLDLMSATASVSLGGLGITLVKMAIGGKLGMEMDLRDVPSDGVKRDDFLLFSESQSRFVVTVDPKKQAEFEKMMPDAKLVGNVRADQRVLMTGLSGEFVLDITTDKLEKAYKETFKDY